MILNLWSSLFVFFRNEWIKVIGRDTGGTQSYTSRRNSRNGLSVSLKRKCNGIFS